MRTFDLSATLDMPAVVVPEQFTKAMREQAQDVLTATPFLKDLQARYPEDDEAFTLAILKNGLRLTIRAAVLREFQEAGLGARIAPASITDRTPPRDAKPVLASEVQAAIPDPVPNLPEVVSYEHARAAA